MLERPLAFDDLYGGYRDDWRVDSEPDSLFTYDTGESLAGSYDPSKPGSVTTVDDFDLADQQAAQQQAEAAGLTPGTVNYDNAVLDFLLTGDQSFVESAANEEVAAPETASVASTLDQGQARATLQIDVKDRDGFDVDGAQVGFSAGNTTALSLADNDGGGDYSLSVGEGTSGRVNGTMEFTNASNTITSADALDVLRLAVGFEPSWGTAEGMDFVAADVTRDGQVTSADALEVLRAAAGFDSPGGTAPKWVFLDQNLDVSGADQNSVPTEEGVDIAAIGAGGAFVSLEAVLLGDMADFNAV